ERGGIGSFVVRNVAERKHTNRLSFLEARLSRDLPGRNLPAVDGRAVAELTGAQAGHGVDDAVQRLAPDVTSHGREVLGRGRPRVGIDAVGAPELDPTARV